MLIQKIHIKNITTHVNTQIEFKPGINSLMGENGAGKSSVLLMIGYVLFDYLPGRNQKMYVRMDAKKKFGVVKLWIVANDGEEYVIRRTVGKKANDLSVTHCETKIIIKEISTVYDLKEWLHEILGIRENLPLKTIFDGGIGVRQGTFTEPFLRNPTERAQVFSPLLNVDIYSKLHKNFLTTVKELEHYIHQQDLLVNRLLGELTEKKQLGENQEKLISLLDVSKENLSIIENQWNSVDKQFNKLTKIKDSLEKLKTTYELTKRDIQGQKSTISELNQNLEQAKAATQICQQTEKLHLDYVNLEKQTKILREQIKTWRNAQDALVGMKNQITRLEGRRQQIEKSIGEMGKYKEELPRLNKIHTQFEEKKKTAEKLQIELLRIMDTEKLIHDLDLEIQQRQLIPAKLEKIQEELRITQNSLASLKETAENAQQNQIQEKSTQNQINELHSYIEQAQSGICPVCDQPYHSEHQDLTSYFQDKIHKLEKKTAKLQLERKSLEQNLAKAAQLEERKEKCIRLETQYEEKLLGYKEKSKQLEIYRKEIQNKKSLEIKFQAMKKEIDDLTADNQRFEFISVKVTEELSQLQTDLDKIQKEIAELVSKSQPLEKEVESGKELDSELNQAAQKLETLKPSHEKYQENHRIAQNLPRISLSLQEKNNEMQAANETLRLITAQIKTNTDKFDIEQYKSIESQRSIIQIQLIQKKEEFKQINMQLDQITQRLIDLKAKELILVENQKKLDLLQDINQFSDTLRNWYKEAGPKITEALISDINAAASALYRQIKGEESVTIEWQKDYDVVVKSAHISERFFSQLSGGEQMAVALAIRLAILKILTKIDFAFFDEPTTNLDENKRINLAQCIQNIRGFRQLFIISHDDTFEEYADNVIRLSKANNEETQVEMVSF